MEPNKETAEQALLEAEKSNPGPWADHSRYVAQKYRTALCALVRGEGLCAGTVT